MGQPVLPKWQRVGARCVAKIGGKSYDAVISQALDYGYWHVRIAVPNPWSGQTIVTNYKQSVPYKNLIMREKRVPELDGQAA